MMRSTNDRAKSPRKRYSTARPRNTPPPIYRTRPKQKISWPSEKRGMPSGFPGS